MNDQLKQRLAAWVAPASSFNHNDKAFLREVLAAIEQQEQQIAEVREAVDAGPNCSTIEAVLGTLKAYESCADEKLQLEAQLRERDAQCAAMRECLETLLRDKFGGFWKPIQQALSTDAGKDLLERLQKAEGELLFIDAILARRPALSDFSTRAGKIEHAINIAKKADKSQDRLQAVEKERDRYKQLLEMIAAYSPVQSWIRSLDDLPEICRNVLQPKDAK